MTPPEPIPVERCRPFSLGDAMIFVAAAAVGLALVQGSGMFALLWSNLRALPFGMLPGWSAWWVYLTKTNRGGTETIVLLASNVMVAFLMPLTVAYLIARLRRPRPALRRLWWQPGMIASEAWLVTFGLGAFLEIGQPPGLRKVWFAFALVPLPLSWVVLALSGRWRREPGWIDRLGVGLGIGWCLEILALLFFMFVG